MVRSPSSVHSATGGNTNTLCPRASNDNAGLAAGLSRENAEAADQALELERLRAELAKAVVSRDEWCRQCNFASEYQADTSAKLAKAVSVMRRLSDDKMMGAGQMADAIDDFLSELQQSAGCDMKYVLGGGACGECKNCKDRIQTGAKP